MKKPVDRQRQQRRACRLLPHRYSAAPLTEERPGSTSLRPGGSTRHRHRQLTPLVGPAACPAGPLLDQASWKAGGKKKMFRVSPVDHAVISSAHGDDSGRGSWVRKLCTLPRSQCSLAWSVVVQPMQPQNAKRQYHDTLQLQLAKQPPPTAGLVWACLQRSAAADYFLRYLPRNLGR